MRAVDWPSMALPVSSQFIGLEWRAMNGDPRGEKLLSPGQWQVTRLAVNNVVLSFFHSIFLLLFQIDRKKSIHSTEREGKYFLLWRENSNLLLLLWQRKWPDFCGFLTFVNPPHYSRRVFFKWTEKRWATSADWNWPSVIHSNIGNVFQFENESTIAATRNTFEYSNEAMMRCSYKQSLAK